MSKETIKKTPSSFKIKDIIKILFKTGVSYVAVVDKERSLLLFFIDKDSLVALMEKEGELCEFNKQIIENKSLNSKDLLGRVVLDEGVKQIPVFDEDGLYLGMWPKGKLISLIDKHDQVLISAEESKKFLSELDLLPFPLVWVEKDKWGCNTAATTLFKSLGLDLSEDIVSKIKDCESGVILIANRRISVEEYKLEDRSIYLLADITEHYELFRRMQVLSVAFLEIAKKLEKLGWRIRVEDKTGDVYFDNLKDLDSSEVEVLRLLDKENEIGSVVLAMPEYNLDADDQAKGLRELLLLTEKEAIVKALRRATTISEAAKILGIPRQTLQYRIRKLGIKTKLKEES